MSSTAPFTTAGLVDCLSHIPPVELEALRLLREARLSATGQWFPVAPLYDVASATQELISYIQACAALINKLKNLAPVTLSTVEIPEWPL